MIETYNDPYGFGEVVLATSDELVVDFTCVEDDGTIHTTQRTISRAEVAARFDYGDFKRRFDLVSGSSIIWYRAIMALGEEEILSVDTYFGTNPNPEQSA